MKTQLQIGDIVKCKIGNQQLMITGFYNNIALTGNKVNFLKDLVDGEAQEMFYGNTCNTFWDVVKPEALK